MGTSIPRRVACKPAHLRKNWGKKNKTMDWGGGVEWGGVNIGMKTWHLASTSVVRGNSRVIRKWGIGRKFVLSDAKSKVKKERGGVL